MKILRIMLLLLLPLLLSGCYDAREPNDIAYTIALGVDIGEENMYEITLQFAKPAQISGGSGEEGGKGGADSMEMVTVKAPDIYSALNLANHVVSKRFVLSHMKLMVLSKETAERGINDILEVIGRSNEIRPNMYVCVANGRAKEYLESVKPVVETNPIRYYQLIFENDFSSYVPKNVSQDLYFYCNSDTRQSVLPLVAAGGRRENENERKGTGSDKSQNGSEENSQAGEETEQKSEAEENERQAEKQLPEAKMNTGGFEYHLRDYVAGNLDVDWQNTGETIGAAVFLGDKMIAVLGSIESELYNLMSYEYKYSYTTIYSPQTPEKPVTIKLEQVKKPKIRVVDDGGGTKIYLELRVEGDFISIPPQYSWESYIKEFEANTEKYLAEACEKLLYRTSRELGADIIGFGEYAQRLFLTEKEFEAYNWQEKYKNAEFYVTADFQIRQSGLILKTAE